MEVTLTGRQGRDYIIGGSQDDILTGGSGQDTLIGGAESDIFLYPTLNDGSDVIEDFQSGTDFLRVSAVGFGGGLTAGQNLGTRQFTIGDSATDSSDRFIYNSNNGNLFFDGDGTGSNNQLLIATFTSKPELVSNDIFVAA